jgi:hypothetical protein
MPNKFQRHVIKDALDNPEKLTDWENERMQEWAEYPDDRELSEKQNAVINQISQKLQ